MARSAVVRQERYESIMAKASVLIADDDRLVLATLANGLREAGYTILEANDGKAALRLCEEQHPDIAILDIRMPGIDGIETARRLHEHTGTPFVMLSAYRDEELVEQATEHGAMGYLVKPVDVEQIGPAIETALRRASEIRKLQHNESRLVHSLKMDQVTSTAVGVIMERHHLSREDAFEKLRRHARSQRCRLTEIAEDILKAVETANIN